jgi:hypothetical protein
MEPSPCTPLIESFPKTPRMGSEASQFGGSHNYKAKQTTFLHREMSSFYKILVVMKRGGLQAGSK